MIHQEETEVTDMRKCSILLPLIEMQLKTMVGYSLA